MVVAKGQERPWQYVVTSPVLLGYRCVLNTSISRGSTRSRVNFQIRLCINIQTGRPPVSWSKVIDLVGLLVENVAQENRKIKTQQTCISVFAGIKRGVLCHGRERFVIEGGNQHPLCRRYNRKSGFCHPQEHE